MRMLLAAPALVTGLVLSGCAGGGSGDDPGDTGGGTAGRSPSSSPSAGRSEDGGGSGGSAASGRDAVCAKVRTGINAFNAGDLQDTVVEFKEAVPIAEQAKRQDPSRESSLLLRAVRYYAALPANDYPEASAGSLEFQRWKQVTLTLCVSGQDQLSPGPDPQDSAIPA